MEGLLALLVGVDGCDFYTGAIKIMLAPWVCVFARTLAIRFQGGLANPFILVQSCVNVSGTSAKGSGHQLK